MLLSCEIGEWTSHALARALVYTSLYKYVIIFRNTCRPFHEICVVSTVYTETSSLPYSSGILRETISHVHFYVPSASNWITLCPIRPNLFFYKDLYTKMLFYNDMINTQICTFLNSIQLPQTNSPPKGLHPDSRLNWKYHVRHLTNNIRVWRP